MTAIFSLLLCAQAPGAFAAGATDAIMEEILVYGTKKGTAEVVQDIPAQVVAFGSESLEAQQVINIEDLSFATPNVQLESIGTQVSFAAFSIRGLGVDNSTPTIDPNVGSFIDGVYAGVPFGVVTDTFDLESVEIYKGPQALLFGRNVTGGAVLMRSKRPGGDFGFDVKATVEDNMYILAAAVEGALVPDVLAGRISVQYKDDSGWYKNDFLDEHVGDSESEFFRGSLLYTPSESIDLTLIFEDGHTDGEQTPVNNVFDASRSTYSFDNPVTPQNSDFNVEQDYMGVTDLDWQQITFEAGIDVGENGRITNIMGYRKVESETLTDVDGVNPTTPGARLNIIGIYVIDQDQFSNELRYNQVVGDRWEFTAGLVYFTQEATYGTGLWRGGLPGIDHPSNVFGGGTQDNDSWSFYFNNEFAVTDTFSLTGGFNYLTEDKDVMIVPRAPSSLADGLCDINAQTCDFAGQGVPSDDDWNNFSPKLGFKWQVLEDGHVYGHIARAYRSGFFNVRQTNPNSINLNATDVEKHTSYELGIKSSLAEGAVRLNAAVFFQDIEDLARSAGGEVLINGLPSPFQDLLNVGDAEIKGFEFDVTGLVGDNLVINASVGYLDGDITNAEANINKSKTDGVTDIVGDEIDETLDIVRLSKWTTHLGLVYDMDLGDSGVLTLRAEHSYRSKSAARDDNAQFFPSVDIINAGMTYEPREGNWKVTLYGKNLGDKVVYKTLFSIANQVFAPISKGRRYGLEFRYSL
ncbi:MAG: TonB-dependent receptor [Pseudomonadales bacterium]|nr:TonB-dependent receptor [Pseudomonadales bacterium]